MIGVEAALAPLPGRLPYTAAPMGADAMDTMLAVLGDLWPGSSPAVVGHADAGAGSPTFLPIPSARAPRLLVPADSKRAAASAMLRFSTALRVREAVQRSVVGLGLRGGCGRLLPERVVVRGAVEATSLRAHLGAQIGEAVSFSLGVGSARVNRKPVLQLFDPSGRTVGFAKVGHASVSIADVSAEARALDLLGSMGWRSIELPARLWSGEWNGMFALVMTAVRTSPLQRPRLRDVPPLDAMAELAHAFGEGNVHGLAGTAWHSRLVGVCGDLVEPAVRARFEAALARTVDHAAGHSWELGAWHGDWTPWNMARRRDGIVQLWDWERLERGVPVGLDALHFVVNERVRMNGAGVAVIHGALEAAGADGTPGTRAHALGGAYLASITARYLRGSQLPGGEAIAGRSIDFLEALEAWVR